MSLGTTLPALRRDLAAILGNLLGRHPSPLIDRTKARRAPVRAHSSAIAPRPLRVVDVVRETSSATSIVLEDPTGRPIEFVPGQFFTVLVDVGGATLRRAYSASSSHLEPERLRLTSKRVDGGVVSNHLNDTARVGQTLRVLGPSGNFTYHPDPAAPPRHLLLIGGGSGITPLIAIARAAITVEPATRVTLLYANRAPDQVIFRAELDALAEASDGRLTVRYDYGLFDPQRVADLLDPLDEPPAAHYLCGPEPMMALARDALLARGVATEAILTERFASPHPASPTRTDPQPVVFHIDGAEHTVTTRADETLLDAGLRADLELAYSCTMGGCGACMARATGAVTMEEPNCLTEAERAEGYILPCVSRATEPVTVEVE